MVVLVVMVLVLALAPPASAHVARTSGQFRVEMGWADEPALSGEQNAVEVELADASGAPVRVPAGALSVEVAVGGGARTFPLVPGEAPGAYGAVIVPTRPGTYAFHVTGAVRGRTLDARATCSERTFDCVQAASAFQFPAREPSAAEVAQRADREIARAKQDADDAAADARRIALAALVVAVLALVAAVFVALRARRARS